MKQKIESLNTTTFAGRRFTRKQLSVVQQTVQTFPSLSLRELAHTVCENLDWVTSTGTNKIQTCLNALEAMQTADLFVLPKKKERSKRKQKPIPQSHHTDPQSVITGSLAQWDCLTLQTVTAKDEVERWNAFVDRYHYLGYKRPIGTHLRYFIVAQGHSGDEQILGCLLFAFATVSLDCRDQWIGWDEQARQRRLNLVVNNNRFLILPWVEVKNLASKVLSMAAAQVPDDWMALHRFRPVLMETFVDPDKYMGTCYQAANWQLVGQTKGKKGSARVDAVTQKDVYVYPLTTDYQAQLIEGKQPSLKRHGRKKAPKLLSPSTLAPNDPFIILWQRIAHIVFEVAEDFDQQWQIRRRVIDTRLLILLIFRLVLSKNKQGYGATLLELWDQCRLMNIPLPSAKPVAQSSFSNARKKLDESIFKSLNSKIISAYEVGLGEQRWQTHRVFAVDCTKINLPRQLLDQPYRLPSDKAYYPQGMVSCLYQIKSKIPYDFDLVAHRHERTPALAHLKVLKPLDLVIYDRGYFSYGMLYHHLEVGVDVVFRLQPNSSTPIRKFFNGTETDQIVSLEMPTKRHNEVRRKYPDVEFKSLQLRLVKYVHDETTYFLGTSLLDQERYPIRDLSDLYHSRWGIEELYKISKELIEVEDFHAQTERGVKQELFAHFVLMTINRVFTNHADTQLNDGEIKSFNESVISREPLFRVNIKNALTTMARTLESLLFAQRTQIAGTINKLMDSIMTCRQKERPGRKYQRLSRKPESKWRALKNKRPTAAAV